MYLLNFWKLHYSFQSNQHNFQFAFSMLMLQLFIFLIECHAGIHHFNKRIVLSLELLCRNFNCNDFLIISLFYLASFNKILSSLLAVTRFLLQLLFLSISRSPLESFYLIFDTTKSLILILVAISKLIRFFPRKICLFQL